MIQSSSLFSHGSYNFSKGSNLGLLTSSVMIGSIIPKPLFHFNNGINLKSLDEKSRDILETQEWNTLFIDLKKLYKGLNYASFCCVRSDLPKHNQCDRTRFEAMDASHMYKTED